MPSPSRRPRSRATPVRLLRYALVPCCMLGATAGAQAKPELPFAPGERFSYEGHVHSGIAGSGTLRVEGPAELRGTTTWVIRSEMEGHVGPFKGTDVSESWLDPARLTTLRYSTRERHVLTRHDETVDVFAADATWRDASNTSGRLLTREPLDELSFLYYLRTLPLKDGDAGRVSRHFDATRNPTLLRVIGREDISVGGGRFHAVTVEMRVRDARRYQGEGVIRVSMSDDRCRLILRIESTVPREGAASLSLVSYEGMARDCSAKLPD